VTHLFSELVAGGTTTDGNYYTIGGRSVWLPGPALAAARVEYAYAQGLQNIIIWELGQDVHPTFVHPVESQRANKTSLLRAAFEAKLALHSPKGDYDGDGDTDESDYLVWSTTLGSTGKVRADGNGDQIVDAADYILWRKMAGAGGAGGAATTASVPEPTFATILFAAALLIVGRFRIPAGS
jgi:hypothetical protein